MQITPELENESDKRKSKIFILSPALELLNLRRHTSINMSSVSAKPLQPKSGQVKLISYHHNHIIILQAKQRCVTKNIRWKVEDDDDDDHVGAPAGCLTIMKLDVVDISVGGMHTISFTCRKMYSSQWLFLESGRRRERRRGQLLYFFWRVQQGLVNCLQDLSNLYHIFMKIVYRKTIWILRSLLLCIPRGFKNQVRGKNIYVTWYIFDELVKGHVCIVCHVSVMMIPLCFFTFNNNKYSREIITEQQKPESI